MHVRYAGATGSCGRNPACLITPDANLLIYAYNTKAQQPRAARAWLEDVLGGVSQVGLLMQSVLAFIRLTTTIMPTGDVFTVAEALSIVDLWLSRPQVSILHPGPGHWAIFRRLCLATEAKSNLSTDAHLAALAIEHAATLHTADRHFARFADLRWVNPLAE